MRAPTHLRLTARAATKAIRQRASTTFNVVFTTHAQTRMRERDISAPEVFRILREGIVYELPIRTDEGDWKAEIELRLPGGGVAAAVTVLHEGDRLIVVTVMWRDLR
jgi:hypothetical protein